MQADIKRNPLLSTKSSRSDDWLMAALLLATLVEAGVAFHQMNQVALSDKKLPIVGAVNPTTTPQPADFVSLM